MRPIPICRRKNQQLMRHDPDYIESASPYDWDARAKYFDRHPLVGNGLSESDYLIMQEDYFDRTGRHLDEKGFTWLPSSQRPLNLVACDYRPVAGWSSATNSLWFDSLRACLKSYLPGRFGSRSGCKRLRTPRRRHRYVSSPFGVFA